MRKEDIKKIEEEEGQLAEERAIARKNGKFDTAKSHRVFRNLIDNGIWINPRVERYKNSKERDQSRLKNQINMHQM